MPTTMITRYLAEWRPEEKKGRFWFFYFKKEKEGGHNTPWVDGESFAIMIDMLRNEKPVYGDHTTGYVLTQLEKVGEEET